MKRTEIEYTTPPRLIKAADWARRLWSCLPGLSRGVTCHALARAFEPALNDHWSIMGVKFKVVDGYFGVNSATHSWLALNDPQYLLDVYPWACHGGGPLLIDIHPLSPWSQLYRPADDWLQKQLQDPTEHWATGKLEAAEAVRAAIAKMKDQP